MPTGEDAQTQTILLDPVLSFGLVGTTSKTKSFSDVAVATKSVPADNAKHVVAIIKNKSQPSGVTFTLTLRLRFTVPANCNSVGFYNRGTSPAGPSTNTMYLGMHDPSSSADFSNTGETVTLKNITQNTSVNVAPNTDNSIDVSPGDTIEVCLPYKEGWDIKVAVNSSCGNITDLQIFYRIDVTIYHDGSLAGGKGVECSFEVYDADGSTLLGTYTFEGLVNPFAQAQVQAGVATKVGLTRLADIDLGDYVLDPSAPVHYLRVIVAEIKDRATGQAVSLDDFNLIQVALRLEDGEGNVVASTPLEQVTQLPFNGSWSDAINPPDTQTTYKPKLHIEVNPKYAKRYEVDLIVQLGM